jgi:hypothetical protein
MVANSILRPLFPLGQVVATPGALQAFEDTDQSPSDLLTRHLRGDWGDLDAEDKQANDRAIAEGSRIFSAYHLSDGTKIYLITEADRSVTTFLLPDEY